MEEQEDSAVTAQNPNQYPPRCQECKLNPAKYTCPDCSVRSCSLPCVQAHKQHTGCTGKRQQTQFVPLSQFDDNLLKSGTFFFLKFCSLLLNSCTHLAILKTYHEYIVIPLKNFTVFLVLKILVCFSILKMFTRDVW